MPVAPPKASAPIDLDKCHHTPGSADEDYGSWLGEGYAGIAVYVTAGDQRSLLGTERESRARNVQRKPMETDDDIPL